MRLSIIAFCCIALSQYSIAQTNMGVTHNKDGNVLKSHILENNFQRSQYDIELQGGKLLEVSKIDVQQVQHEKSSLEPISLDQSYQGYPTSKPDIKPNIPQALEDISGSLYLGSSTHTLTTHTGSFTQDSVYTGISMAGQIHLNRFFALYTEFNLGSFSKLKITDELGGRITQSGNELADESYLSKQIGLIISTNLNTGWQVFTGAGAFSERYSTSDASFEAYGGSLQMGLGYSWQNFQITSRLQYFYSPDYPETVKESSTGHIQLGFNF